MKYTTALIVYSGSRHTQHTKILNDLQQENIEQRELDLPTTEDSNCPLTEQINNTIDGVDLLIVYLSKYSKNHPCIDYCINVAHQQNIRIIGIWLDDAELRDLNTEMDQLGDSICIYDDSFTETILSDIPVWTNPDGTEPTKRTIKKHICG